MAPCSGYCSGYQRTRDQDWSYKTSKLLLIIFVPITLWLNILFIHWIRSYNLKEWITSRVSPSGYGCMLEVAKHKKVEYNSSLFSAWVTSQVCRKLTCSFLWFIASITTVYCLLSFWHVLNRKPSIGINVAHTCSKN